MRVARAPAELEPRSRTVAIGSFDGVHTGHRAVLAAVAGAGGTATLVTFDPHPRTVLGEEVRLLTTAERRLELVAEAGVEEALVLRFDEALAELSAERFAESVLRPIGTRVVAAGPGFRFGRGRAGDLAVLERLGFETVRVPPVPGVSSTAIRQLAAAGAVAEVAPLLGRPAELEGTVVAGDARGATLGFPTANVAVRDGLLVPANGIYAGAAAGHRAAVSIGTNPTYGGSERRVEAYLLDFEGDLYGRRLVVELWQRLRDEQAFPGEAELVAQIARDVEATRAATRPG
jgi:riboflavin kinase / FMN adenylyltransferase